MLLCNCVSKGWFNDWSFYHASLKGNLFLIRNDLRNYKIITVFAGNVRLQNIKYVTLHITIFLIIATTYLVLANSVYTTKNLYTNIHDYYKYTCYLSNKIVISQSFFAKLALAFSISFKYTSNNNRALMLWNCQN